MRNQDQVLQQLVNELTDDGHLTEEQSQKAGDILKENSGEHLPWFVHTLQGIGAWFAALMFVLFFALSRIISGEAAYLVSGLILLGVSLFFSINKEENQSTFVSQLLLAMSLTGHVLVAAGLYMIVDSLTLTAGALALLSLLFIRLYSGYLHRFLSVFVLLISVMVMAYDLKFGRIMLQLMLLFLTVLMTGMWIRESHFLVKPLHRMYRALQYALACALLLGAGWLDFAGISFLFGQQSVRLFAVDWIASIGILLAMLWVMFQIFKRQAIALTSPNALLLTALALALNAIFFQTPAIMASLLVLILGIERGNRLLIPLAIISLIFHIVRFYYLLDMTLLDKSILLMGSGLLLIAGGVWMYRQQEKLV